MELGLRFGIEAIEASNTLSFFMIQNTCYAVGLNAAKGVLSSQEKVGSGLSIQQRQDEADDATNSFEASA